MNPNGQNPDVDEPAIEPPMLLAWPFVTVGRKTISLVNNLGAAAIFLAKAFLMIFRTRQLPGIMQQVFGYCEIECGRIWIQN